MDINSLTKEQQSLILEKHKLRMKLRAEYLKESSNPFLHAKGEGGHLFDAGLQRFQAMRVSNYEHFKPTGKSFLTGLLCVAGPIIVYAWMMKSSRDAKEADYRAGKVAYRDRQFKFI